MEREEWSIDARATIISLGLETYLPLGSSVQLHAGPGMGVFYLNVKGRANSPLTSKELSIVTGVPQIRAGVSISPADKISFRLDIMCGWTLHKAVIQAVDDEIATGGRPLLAVSGGIELWIW